MNHLEALRAVELILRKEERDPVGFVGAVQNPEVLKRKLDLTLPETGVSDEVLLKDLENYLKHTPHTLTPRFQNQLFSGLHPASFAGEVLATVTNTTMATYEVSPVATLMERELTAHIRKKIGWPEGDGIMVTGGSNANFVGMLLARNLRFPETKLNGNGSLKLTAFVSEESHYSFDKACNMMGLGISSLKKVPSDPEGKMDVSALREAIQTSLANNETPFFIGATAGTTVLGAYDPIDAISKIAREFNLWLHVDGAWGGCAVFSEKMKHLVQGIEAADSVGVDTHKMLGTGLMSSFLVTKHPHALRRSNDSGGADYIFHPSDESDWNTGPSSLQCGRRADAVKVWMLWRALGDRGVGQMVENLFQNAQVAKKLIQGMPELSLLHDPAMLNVCFDFTDKNIHVGNSRKRLLQTGNHYVNIATRKNLTFFRMIVAHPELNEKVLKETLVDILKHGVSQ